MLLINYGYIINIWFQFTRIITPSTQTTSSSLIIVHIFFILKSTFTIIMTLFLFNHFIAPERSEEEDADICVEKGTKRLCESILQYRQSLL